MNEQGQTFTAFVARELETERDRRKTLDARGVSVVTVSGSLATLLVAVAAFAGGQSGVTVPDAAVTPLTVTLLAFATAAFFGLVATFLWSYKAAKVVTMRKMLNDEWMTVEADARNLAAELDVTTIASLRRGNKWKAWLLIAALVCQVAGLAALVLAVYHVLQAAS